MSTPLGCDEKSSRVNGDMVNVTDSTGKTWKISNQNLFANLPISENPFDIDELSPISTLEDDDFFAVLDDTDGQHKKISKANLESEIGGGGGGGEALPYILLRDEKSSGTHGGSFVSGARRTRDLNQEVIDTDNNCSLASNQFTLTAGTYRIHAISPAWQTVGTLKSWLYNVTDDEDTLVGSSAVGDSGPTEIRGVFTISASKTFEIQNRCQSTINTYGFGYACGWDTEIYTVVELWKRS